MNISQDTIDQVLSMVLDELGRDGEPSAAPATDGLYDTIDEAVTSAVEAQRRLIAMTLETRHKIIEAIRAAALANNEMMSALAVRETTLGRYEDKVRENILCATKTPGTEDISPQAVTGDHGLMLLEFAPVGVDRGADADHQPHRDAHPQLDQHDRRRQCRGLQPPPQCDGDQRHGHWAHPSGHRGRRRSAGPDRVACGSRPWPPPRSSWSTRR